MASTDLTLPEEILALVLTARDGSLLDHTHYQNALAGAVLMELRLNEWIALEKGSSGWLVTPVRKKRTGDPVMDYALKELYAAPRRTDPSRWIDRFAEAEGLRLEVARQLCRKKVLDEHEGRVRLIFLRTVYADLDEEVEADLVERVRDAVFTDEPIEDVRTAIVVSLAVAAKVASRIFDPEKVFARIDRLRTIFDRVELPEETRATAEVVEEAVRTATRSAVREERATTL